MFRAITTRQDPLPTQRNVPLFGIFHCNVASISIVITCQSISNVTRQFTNTDTLPEILASWNVLPTPKLNIRSVSDSLWRTRLTLHPTYRRFHNKGTHCQSIALAGLVLSRLALPFHVLSCLVLYCVWVWHFFFIYQKRGPYMGLFNVIFDSKIKTDIATWMENCDTLHRLDQPDMCTRERKRKEQTDGQTERMSDRETEREEKKEKEKERTSREHITNITNHKISHFTNWILNIHEAEPKWYELVCSVVGDQWGIKFMHPRPRFNIR